GKTVLNLHQVEFGLLQAIGALQSAENRDIQAYAKQRIVVPLVGADHVCFLEVCIRHEEPADIGGLRQVTRGRKSGKTGHSGRDLVANIKLLQIPVRLQELIVTPLSIIPAHGVFLQNTLIYFKRRDISFDFQRRVHRIVHLELQQLKREFLQVVKFITLGSQIIEGNPNAIDVDAFSKSIAIHRLRSLEKGVDTRDVIIQ